MAGKYGPFASEEEVRLTGAAAAERAAWEANPVPGEGGKFNLRMLLAACEETGLELGAYDLSPLRQVAMYENSKCVALRGIIRRAFEAGQAAGPGGTFTEWGACRRGEAEPFVSGPGEAEVRRFAEDLPGVVTGLMSRQVTPWMMATGEKEGNG